MNFTGYEPEQGQSDGASRPQTPTREDLPTSPASVRNRAPGGENGSSRRKSAPPPIDEATGQNRVWPLANGPRRDASPEPSRLERAPGQCSLDQQRRVPHGIRSPLARLRPTCPPDRDLAHWLR